MDNASDNRNMKRVAIAILSYLRKNPDAKDNLEGIASWWVNEHRALVQKSLSLLTSLGAIKEDRAFYSLSDDLKRDASGAKLNALVHRLQSFDDSRN